jgi:hypothetical protein
MTPSARPPLNFHQTTHDAVKLTMTRTQVLSLHSSFIENALRHVFLSQLFRAAWERNHADKLQIYNNEVDDSGLDLVANLGSVTRHIQLKATHTEGRAQSISAHVALSAAKAAASCGCFTTQRSSTSQTIGFSDRLRGRRWSTFRFGKHR